MLRLNVTDGKSLMTLLSHPSPKLSTSQLNLLSYCKKSLVIEIR